MSHSDKCNPRKRKTPRRSPEQSGFCTPKRHWQMGLIPPLPPGEYASLKKSISDMGVRVPIVVDQLGDIIDGYHRDRACRELQLDCPREVREFNSDVDRYEAALVLNCSRRHLNCKQRRELVAAYLKIDPAVNDSHLGEIVGCSKNTVAAVRGELEHARQIDRVEQRRGRDGKQRPAKYKRIIANNDREAGKALEMIKNMPPGGKLMDVTTAARRARLQAARNAKEVAGKAVAPSPADAIRLYHCKFQDLAEMAGIEPGSVPLICTDFPYIKEFLPQLGELAQFAQRVLVDGGLFVTYSGAYFLDQVMQAFSEHLTYRWAIATVWTGPGNPVYPLAIISRWKPVLIYSKGGWTPRGGWSDVLQFDTKEKSWHEWQQPLPEVESLVKFFSQPGDVVVDPCGGAFTTALACRNLGRRFVGCDVEERCVLLGQERLASTKATTVNTSSDHT